MRNKLKTVRNTVHDTTEHARLDTLAPAAVVEEMQQQVATQKVVKATLSQSLFQQTTIRLGGPAYVKYVRIDGPKHDLPVALYSDGINDVRLDGSFGLGESVDDVHIEDQDGFKVAGSTRPWTVLEGGPVAAAEEFAVPAGHTALFA